MHLRSVAVTALLTAATASFPLASGAYAQPGPRTDCRSFSTQAEAQAAFDDDPESMVQLDLDTDFIACEMLPGAPASDRPTKPARPTTRPTTSPTPKPTEPTPTASPTKTAVPVPPATRTPSGPPRAGAGGAATDPADFLLPLGLALTTLTVGAGVLTLYRRHLDGDA